jgi:hypothetical protein
VVAAAEVEEGAGFFGELEVAEGASESAGALPPAEGRSGREIYIDVMNTTLAQAAPNVQDMMLMRYAGDDVGDRTPRNHKKHWQARQQNNERSVWVVFSEKFDISRGPHLRHKSEEGVARRMHGAA